MGDDVKRKIIFLLILIFFVLSFFFFSNLIEEVAVSAVPGRERVVILDPGHGGIDGGAVGINGAIEKDLNLSISLMTYDYFSLLGYNCVMTRDSDMSIHDEGRTIRGKKRSDLENRLCLTKKLPNPLYISIHQNKFTISKYDGFQIFYSNNNSESKPLADSVHNSMLEIVDPDNTRKVKQAPDSVYLMKKITCPAILVECGFLSNREEAEKLLSKDYQNKIALAVFNGVQKYIAN